jgi:hypothetical protein
MLKVKYWIVVTLILGVILIGVGNNLHYDYTKGGIENIGYAILYNIEGLGFMLIGGALMLWAIVKYGVLKYNDKLHWWHTSPKGIIRAKQEDNK